MELRGTTVVITGASTGIGRTTALLLAREGARVIAAARDEKRLAELAAEHSAITSVPTDVSVAADRARLVEAAGDVDVLVNNAGVGYRGLVEDMAYDDVQRLFDVNVLGLIDLTLRVLPGMVSRGRGHIVNVGSMAGYVGAPTSAVYCATKFAIQGFTDALRRETLGRGVDVTLVAPGPIKTEFNARVETGAPAETPGALDSGLPPERVALAIKRGLLRPKTPGYQTITVPRIGGFGRLGSVPGIAHATNLATKRDVKKALAERASS